MDRRRLFRSRDRRRLFRRMDRRRMGRGRGNDGLFLPVSRHLRLVDFAW